MVAIAEHQAPTPSVLTSRWTPLKFHETQNRFFHSNRRFQVIPSGRRSGKTEIAKRKLIIAAITFSAFPDGRFVAAAPTHSQAKDIFWDDLKAMVPDWALRGNRFNSIAESTRTIFLWNGAKIQVIGLDKPERAEGTPIDGIILDEYGNMKESVWKEHIRPALSTPGRPGWAIFIGVPEGRNHYYYLYLSAHKKDKKDWAAFHWKTAEINPEEAEAAKEDMDLLTWQQEYEGSFVTFEGRCYYTFDRKNNMTPDGERLIYQPGKDLIIMMDFNRKPGVAAIAQEQEPPAWMQKRNGNKNIITAGIGEVYIENNSNTEVVARRLAAEWGFHKGNVLLHGDASGGAKTSQGIRGSDWDIVTAELKPIFGDRLKQRYPKGNPSIRTRVNSVNTRFQNAKGFHGAVLDEKMCPMLIRDFEGVTCDDDGGPDKKSDKKTLLTHISDGWGYYMNVKHPCGAGYQMTRSEL